MHHVFLVTAKKGSEHSVQTKTKRIQANGKTDEQMATELILIRKEEVILDISPRVRLMVTALSIMLTETFTKVILRTMLSMEAALIIIKMVIHTLDNFQMEKE